MRRSFSVVFVWTVIVALFACGDEWHRNAAHADVPAESIRKGARLAAKHCQSCHLLPYPSLLDATSWEKGVLPHMGPRLGIFAYGFERYPASPNNPHLPKGFYPSNPVLSFVDWQNIIDFYTATSPDSLLVPNKLLPQTLSQFAVVRPQYKSAFPLTSFTALDTVKRQVLVFDLSSQQLLRFGAGLQVLDSLRIEGAVSDVVQVGDDLVVSNMGNINPSDAPLGSVQQVQPGTNGSVQPLFDSLQRPVVLKAADINKDGRTDYVVGSFGFFTGHLSWYEALGSGGFRQHIIKPVPGAAQVYITDENSDGLPDLWVLFAQGDESIRRFINRGDGQFEETVVLRFPPVYGSTSFELVDMDGDGDKDIVYTCGDNADFSPVLKPYHGVYVFVQQGGNFKQQYFYHLNGAFKARTADFDQDGDQDIAAISFFADYNRQPAQGFVYLQNGGSWNFAAATFAGAAAGRWITLDAGDLDGDGWTDLVLGNMAKPGAAGGTSVQWEKGPLFVVLRNTGRGRHPL
jgi:hypothetical protein